MTESTFHKNLYSLPKWFYNKPNLSPVVKRVKLPPNPFKGLTFEPNTVAWIVFSQDSVIEAMLWRLTHERINNRLWVGETSEGKTTGAITTSETLTYKKRELAKLGLLPKKALDIRFIVGGKGYSNFRLGQYETLKSQIVFQEARPYEELIYDEFETMVNVMRAMSGQNVDAKNMLDSGRWMYCPISGICPSLGSIDRGISSTRIQWLFVAEFNRGKKERLINVIVYYCVHSRDNFEYKWVKFADIEVEWCSEEDYNQAQELKRRMIATSEGMKTAKRHLVEKMGELKKKEEHKLEIKAEKILYLYKQGEITESLCAYRLYTEIKDSYEYVRLKMKIGWSKAKKLIKEYDKKFMEGTLSEQERKEVEIYESGRTE